MRYLIGDLGRRFIGLSCAMCLCASGAAIAANVEIDGGAAHTVQAQSSGDVILLAQSGESKSRRGARGSRRTQTAEAEPRVVRKSRRGTRGGRHTKQHVARTQVAEAPAPDLPPLMEATYLERFLAEIAAPAPSWESAMVLVVPDDQSGATLRTPVWVDRIQPLTPERFIGAVVTDGRMDQGTMEAQDIMFTRVDIRDWGFVENGQGYGFATLRQGQMTTEDAAEIAAFLAERPLPLGW